MPDVVTPKGDDNDGIAIRSSEEPPKEPQRLRRPSPVPIVLPYLIKDASMSLRARETFQEDPDRYEAEQDVLAMMDEDLLDEDDLEMDNTRRYALEYRKWREECEVLDKQRDEQERLEMQQTLEPGPEPDLPPAVSVNPIDRKSTRLNSSHSGESRMPSSA